MAARRTPPAPSWRSSIYHPACECALNHQIQLELYVIYVYESIACYFEDQISHRYVSTFLLGQAALLNQHVRELIRLERQRIGHARQYESVVKLPDLDQWDSSLEALDYAVYVAVQVSQDLSYLEQLAKEKKDAHLLGFLGKSTLHEQVKSFKEVRVQVSTFPVYPRNPGDSLEEHLLDKLSLDDKKN